MRVLRPTEAECLECRANGHRWDVVVPLVKRRTLMMQTRESRCDRCDSTKVEGINVNGQVETRHYELSEEYKIYTGITRSDARVVQMGGARVVWA